MTTEKPRLYSNCQWPRVAVDNFRYMNENIQNSRLFMSTLGRSVFYDCVLTNIGMSSTDVDELTLHGSTLSAALFKMGQIKKAIFRRAEIVNCKMSNMVIGPGHIGGRTIFKDCAFGKVNFYSISFDDVIFENCKFIKGSFSSCAFTGVFSHITPEKNTENKFINCVMDETTFDSCSFNQRKSPSGIKMFELNTNPSASVHFKKCKGSIIFNNTVNKKGLDTKGFNGTINTVNKNTGIKTTLTSTDEGDYYDGYPWGCNLPNTTEKIKPVKKEHPVRYISAGL